MNRIFVAILPIAIVLCSFNSYAQDQDLPPGKVKLFPANNARKVNPDTYLKLSFENQPILYNVGKIRVYDASNDRLIDELDMSVSPGPKNTRTRMPYASFIYEELGDSVYTVSKPDTDSTHNYQTNYIGGRDDADAYHFYPVLIQENNAIICLHNNRLQYGKTYYVLIEGGVISQGDGSPFEISDKSKWTFSTRERPPASNTNLLVVASDGSADFTTVQGAVDFVPENSKNAVTIYIKNGTYEEIINCRNRTNLNIIGEDREKVVLCYANNSVFNRKAISPDPELTKSFHNIRAVLAVYSSSNVNIANLTLRSLGEAPAQAEALLVIGEKIVVSNVSIEGSGDALQATGTVYVTDSKIQGYGDNVLGYGAVFFNHCDFISTFGPHLWVRNTNKNHGNVLLNCTLQTQGDVQTHIARAPDNHGIKYPYAEAVLIDCKLEGMKPEGWGKVTDSTENLHYWEFNSTNLEDGTPIDASQRHPASKQLTTAHDQDLIKSYRNPSFVLGGWDPSLTPIIIKQPAAPVVRKGGAASFEVQVVAVPHAAFQWYKNGKPIKGANQNVLTLRNLKSQDKGTYYVEITNKGGKTTSQQVKLKV